MIELSKTQTLGGTMLTVSQIKRAIAMRQAFGQRPGDSLCDRYDPKPHTTPAKLKAEVKRAKKNTKKKTTTKSKKNGTRKKS